MDGLISVASGALKERFSGDKMKDKQWSEFNQMIYNFIRIKYHRTAVFLFLSILFVGDGCFLSKSKSEIPRLGVIALGAVKESGLPKGKSARWVREVELSFIKKNKVFCVALSEGTTENTFQSKYFVAVAPDSSTTILQNLVSLNQIVASEDIAVTDGDTASSIGKFAFDILYGCYVCHPVEIIHRASEIPNFSHPSFAQNPKEAAIFATKLEESFLASFEGNKDNRNDSEMLQLKSWFYTMLSIWKSKYIKKDKFLDSLIRGPTVQQADNGFLVQFFTWEKIGGCVRQWQFEISERGRVVTGEFKNVAMWVGENIIRIPPLDYKINGEHFVH